MLHQQQRQHQRHRKSKRPAGRVLLVAVAAAVGTWSLNSRDSHADFVVPRQVCTGRSLTRQVAMQGAMQVERASSVVRAGGDAAAEVLSTTVGEGLLSGDRYVVMNRFAVRDHAGPGFEQRWADRDSNLLDMEGFRWFSLLQRVPPSGEDLSYEYPDDNSYVSISVWETKQNVNAWRKSPAFKASHGGDNILGFLGMMVSNFMTAKGPPKPAMWTGVLTEKATEPSPLPGHVAADGKQVLPADVFVSMNRFSVKEGSEEAFEKRWATRESQLDGMPGFRAFQLLRRDQVPDDDVNYVSMAVWDDRAAFDAWRNGEGFKQAHSGAGRPSGSNDAPMGGMLSRPPMPYFYEGKLVMESGKGI